MMRLLWRLVVDEDGQDIIEYGLLAGLIATVGGAVFPVLADAMATAYRNVFTETHNAWQPCDPGSFPCS
jgi:Flp pilus assembly pilin Flp